jgi:hypothetical protein
VSRSQFVSCVSLSAFSEHVPACYARVRAMFSDGSMTTEQRRIVAASEGISTTFRQSANLERFAAGGFSYGTGEVHRAESVSCLLSLIRKGFRCPSSTVWTKCPTWTVRDSQKTVIVECLLAMMDRGCSAQPICSSNSLSHQTMLSEM